jgi:molecular chaperone DnaK (HSP70)
MNICVDFGTCHTVISYIDENNDIKHILNEITGDILIPTIIYFPNGENNTIENINNLKLETDYIIGTNANDCIKQHDDYKYCFTQFKRFLGITKKTINIDFLNKFQYDYELDDDIIYFKIGKLKISIIELIRLFVKGIMVNVKEILKTDDLSVVLTCPAYFYDLQRTQLKNAFESSGLKILKMYNEPTVAGIYYINTIQNNLNEKNDLDKKFIVYDLGGGTMDVTVTQYHNDIETCEILDICGDNCLGGVDIDNILIDDIYNKYEINRDNKKWYNRIKKYAEDIKIKLSHMDSYDIFLENVPIKDKIVDDLKITYTIFNFNRLIKDIIDKMTEPLIEMSKKHETNNIIFIGGPTQIKLLKNTVFSKLKINETESNMTNNIINNDKILYKTIVSKGGITMMNMINDKKKFTLLDITPMNIGIASFDNKMITMIEKNTKTPTTVERIFTTQYDCQRSIDLDIYEGIDENYKNNNFIGSYKIIGIPPLPCGSIIIKLLFKITINGILDISINGYKNSSDSNIQSFDFKMMEKIKIIPTTLARELFRKLLLKT